MQVRLRAFEKVWNFSSSCENIKLRKEVSQNWHATEQNLVSKYKISFTAIKGLSTYVIY